MRITPPIIDYRNVSKVEAVFYNLDFKSSDDSISIPESATSHPHIDRGSIFEITLSDIDPEVDYSQYEISHGIELSRWEAQSKREDLQEKRYTSIENHVLADWLRNTQPNDQPVSSDDTSSVMPIPLAGLRLAFCHLQPRFISAEPRGGSRKGKGRDIGTDLSDAMGVPEELRFLQKGEFCFGKVSPSRLELGPDETEAATKTDPIFICKLSSNSYFRDLIFSYNPETNVTTGYVLLKSGNELDMVGLMRKLETGFFSCPSPLMVPITIIELVADTCRSQMAALHTEFTTSIEEQTGFGAYASRREEGVREKLIYDQLAIRQGELQGRAVLLQTVISGFLSMAEFVSKELQTLEELDENGQDHYYERVYDSRLQEWLQQRVRVTQSFLSSLAGYAGLKERMDIQQTVLFNLIAQRDNELNYSAAADTKEIAIATKRDSSSMKVVAILTTVFLPGTFVSAVFSMPFFDWEASSSKMTTAKDIWIFWAITIPLTLTVMTVLGLYIWYISRQNEINVQIARRKTGLKEA